MRRYLATLCVLLLATLRARRTRRTRLRRSIASFARSGSRPSATSIGRPSRGCRTWDQQRELLAILDRAVALKMNAIVFQVRPGADALVCVALRAVVAVSHRTPGPRARAAVGSARFRRRAGAQARARAARVVQSVSRGVFARLARRRSTHVSRTNPELVWPYDRFLWMDPGDAAVRRRSLRAVVDVVKRYDVDGVHIDDYFYPYPATDRAGKKIDFPDSATYARYRKSGRHARRRTIGDATTSTCSSKRCTSRCTRRSRGCRSASARSASGGRAIRRRSQGFDAYSEIYADSKKWLQNGWADYLAPQLYWPIAQTAQSFPVLYDWWLHRTRKAGTSGPAWRRIASRRRSARTIDRRGDSRRDRHDARAWSRPRPHPLQYVGDHEGRRQRRGEARDALRFAGDPAGIAVARREAAGPADGEVRARPRRRTIRRSLSRRRTVSECGCGPCDR